MIGHGPDKLSGQPKVTKQGEVLLSLLLLLFLLLLSGLTRPPFPTHCAHRAPRGGHRCGCPMAWSPQNETGFVAVTPAAVAG